MSKGGSKTTHTQLDPRMQRYRDEVFNMARDSSGWNAFGVDPASQQAAAGFGRFAEAGNLGLGAMSGDANALRQFMNPYQSQVVDSVNSQFGDMRTAALNNVDEAATHARAFGGDRHGVASGVALAETNKAHGAALTNLIHGGYTDAMGRATQAANLGFGANNALMNFGDYSRNIAMQNDPMQRRFNNMSQVMSSSPYGTSQTVPMQRNALAGGLGGAVSGFAATGSPWGALAGGVAGLFG